MNKTTFPLKVQYTQRYLSLNTRVKQFAGTALRITRGYDNTATVQKEGKKGVVYILLEYLEEIK